MLNNFDNLVTDNLMNDIKQSNFIEFCIDCYLNQRMSCYEIAKLTMEKFGRSYSASRIAYILRQRKLTRKNTSIYHKRKGAANLSPEEIRQLASQRVVYLPVEQANMVYEYAKTGGISTTEVLKLLYPKYKNCENSLVIEEIK